MRMSRPPNAAEREEIILAFELLLTRDRDGFTTYIGGYNDAIIARLVSADLNHKRVGRMRRQMHGKLRNHVMPFLPQLGYNDRRRLALKQENENEL